ncbi:MAG: tryptophan--tRNA ligase [Candidatus Magasanikbacteria bacterium RIFCSPHIGHO2_01_FULL_50_8]|uniref:Tryptophan--tRNA ligase n=2 Tax=Candidatus Magasanikiibacteriota TaxID=1752731 RepID=A0A1F6LUL6_9BACT|nr:MAG: tryptophan--tRNA ligase [Candidatus Magasanikbacteria bacterium RIFCSPHIGHO2_01_FULL_50_8]OGH68187.1 MAG: tryptophan--tRNA ligase [Candidatus Magasanikbacteria bacterium RIFCSPHIGHO2_02_FULL_50_9b]
MKKVIVSGIQPTGDLHIGNYFGAVKNWVALQNDGQFERYFFIPDLHSLSIDYDPREKQRQIRQLVRDLLALGIDPKKSTLFVQSQVPEHTELCWIFLTVTPMSELEKMTQFKDKAERASANINAGLFTYPVLQAADILLYHGSVIPVGEDQVQHIELTRVIAKKFNAKFGRLFPEPQSLLTQTPRVMSLLEPSKKMSKSHGPKSCIFLNDSPDDIAVKIRKAVTDEVGVRNLLDLAQLFDETKLTFQHLKKDFDNGDLKNIELKDTLAELIAQTFAEFRSRRDQISDAEIAQILENGRMHASSVAQKTMKEVREMTGVR